MLQCLCLESELSRVKEELEKQKKNVERTRGEAEDHQKVSCHCAITFTYDVAGPLWVGLPLFSVKIFLFLCQGCIAVAS